MSQIKDRSVEQGEPFFYTNGRQLDVLAHEPPAPTLLNGQQFVRMDPSSKERFLHDRLALSPTEFCLEHAPLPGRTRASDKLHLTVIQTVHAGQKRPAQVLQVRVQGWPQGRSLLAKFYDPLYDRYIRPPPDDEDNHGKDWDSLLAGDGDPFAYADFSYSHESAAYARLQSLQGAQVPHFYGSYTCAIPTRYGADRQVRLILTELVDGTLLRDLVDDATLPQSTRQNILRALIEAESAVYEKGVNHDDTENRNVIVRGKDQNDFADPHLQVALVDFGSASFGKNVETSLPVSPTIRWRTPGVANNFNYWPFVDWNWNAWVDKMYPDSQAYAPVTREVIDAFPMRFVRG